MDGFLEQTLGLQTGRRAGIIDQINRKGTTLLPGYHDVNVALHADRVVYPEDGRIVDTWSLGK